MVGADVDPTDVRGQVVDSIGATLPSTPGKSWPSTCTGSPFGRQSRPPFLYCPTSSFFLVSTLTTGWLSA